jgi:hypothetical protein
MIQFDVPMVLCDPGLRRTLGFSNGDLTTFTEDALNTKCFQVKVILDGPKETGDLPR